MTEIKIAFFALLVSIIVGIPTVYDFLEKKLFPQPAQNSKPSIDGGIKVEPKL